MATLHDVLTQLAGQVPDELLERARDQLAAGDLPEVGRLVRFGRAAYGCTVAPDCYDAIRPLLTESEAAAIVFPRTPVPPYDFHAGGGDDDQALGETVAWLPGVRGLWRVWRTPLGAPSWSAPARIVLVEAERDAAHTVLRSRLCESTEGIVEVLVTGSRWPEYHEWALAASVLLWAAYPCPMPEVAPARPQTLGPPDPEFRRFLDAGADVPGGWRTDGGWVWPAAYSTLDRTHGPLLRHAAERRFAAGAVDGVARHQALAAVRRVTAG